MKKYPSISYLRKELRYNLTKSIRPKILSAFIVGSEAQGSATTASDLDIAIIIPKVKGKTSLQFTQLFNSHFKNNFEKAKWDERIIDFQFFYPNDEELNRIKKIEIY